MTPQDFDDRAWRGALIQDAVGNPGRPYREHDAENENEPQRMVMWIANGLHTPAELDGLKPYDPVTNT